MQQLQGYGATTSSPSSPEAPALLERQVLEPSKQRHGDRWGRTQVVRATSAAHTPVALPVAGMLLATVVYGGMQFAAQLAAFLG